MAQARQRPDSDVAVAQLLLESVVGIAFRSARAPDAPDKPDGPLSLWRTSGEAGVDAGRALLDMNKSFKSLDWQNRRYRPRTLGFGTAR
jgi:hypothetical protein